MITVRRASEQDSQDLFAWRNDPVTRAASLSVAPVGWPEHSLWLAASLANDSRRLFIAMLSEERTVPVKIGMCRFDITADGLSAEVGINLNPGYRGRGLSERVLTAAIVEFRRGDGSGLTLTATIRSSNHASITLFERVGFRLSSSKNEVNYYVCQA